MRQTVVTLGSQALHQWRIFLYFAVSVPASLLLLMIDRLEGVTLLLLLSVAFTNPARGLRFAFCIFIAFYLDAFSIALAKLEASNIISTTLLAGGVFAVGVILTTPKALELAKSCWPLLVLCGLAIVSALWSAHISGTVNQGVQLTFFVLLGIALAGKLGSVEALRLVIRCLSLMCVLSAVLGLLIPEWGQHQATDKEQFVHAGLWRGVFSHKIQLGTLAGVTLTLLIFYGRRAFDYPISFAIAVVASMLCIVKAGSATGLASALFMMGMLFFTHKISLRGNGVRRPILRTVVFALILVIVIMFSGALDELVILLGRSSDMTGRAGYWPFIIDYVNAQGPVLGFGYRQFWVVGNAIRVSAGMYMGEAHNGFLEMIVDFGYSGATLVIGIHVWLLCRSAQLLKMVPASVARLATFPFAFIATLLFSSYAESILLNNRGMWTLLLTIAVCIYVQVRDAMLVRADPPNASQGDGRAVQRR